MLSRSMEVHLHFSEVAVYNYELNATEMCEKFFSFFVYAMWQDVLKCHIPHDLRRRVFLVRQRFLTCSAQDLCSCSAH